MGFSWPPPGAASGAPPTYPGPLLTLQEAPQRAPREPQEGAKRGPKRAPLLSSWRPSSLTAGGLLVGPSWPPPGSPREPSQLVPAPSWGSEGAPGGLPKGSKRGPKRALLLSSWRPSSLTAGGLLWGLSWPPPGAPREPSQAPSWGSKRARGLEEGPQKAPGGLPEGPEPLLLFRLILCIIRLPTPSSIHPAFFSSFLLCAVRQSPSLFALTP